MPERAITIENIGKRYRIPVPTDKVDVLTDRGNNVATRNFYKVLRAMSELGRQRQDFWALRDINLEINKGECIGIIGKNGAGKSTLLKLLSRITEPTEGRIELTGRLAAMLEVGTGFNGELTGRENVYLNGAVLGMTKAEVDRKFASILEFAEVGDFIDTPVKRYSSGMFVRLGFAVAAHLEPEIMIVDEVLAVGDAKFQRKCLNQMSMVANSGRTVLFVSHQMPTIRELCRRVVVLKEGRVIYDGPTEEGIQLYLDEGGAMATDIDLGVLPRGRHIDGSLIMTRVELLDTDDCIFEPEDTLKFRLTMDCKLDVRAPRLKIGMEGNGGIAGSSFTGPLAEAFRAGETYTYTFSIDCGCLAPGVYRSGLQLCDGDSFNLGRVYDEFYPGFHIEVLGRKIDGVREQWSKIWGGARLSPLVVVEGDVGDGLRTSLDP